MVFDARHWDELVEQGYTVVSGAIDDARLRTAQDAANHLNAVHPEEGWERSKNESWREIRHCRHPAFMAVASSALDPLALEILETAPPVDFVQFAVTMPGFATKGGVGRNFHVDGGKDQLIDVFNVLFGVALTPVTSDTAGGFHVLPGSHRQLANKFQHQPDDPVVHWGQLKLDFQREALPGARMVVPHLQPGDIVVAHSLISHGTAPNTTDGRRDMLFQRRAAAPLWDAATQSQTRLAFMRDHWTFFRRPPIFSHRR
jgi:ectoine hydroxylase-related dioxygenase (phytanoyl-CoA dioxygenase family)